MREIVIFFAGVASGIFWVFTGALVAMFVGKAIHILATPSLISPLKRRSARSTGDFKEARHG